MSIEDLVAEQIRRINEAIEAMCERMLTTPGDRGVLVTTMEDGTVQAELSAAVPFGEVHYRSEPGRHTGRE